MAAAVSATAPMWQLIASTELQKEMAVAARTLCACALLCWPDDQPTA
jgi:hypothetical protein